MYLDNIKILVVGDFQSKYLLVKKLWSMSNAHVAQVMRSIFTKTEIPTIIWSDNGTNFLSQDFNMCKSYGITCVTSRSTVHTLPSTWKWLCRKHGKISKKILQKATDAGEDLYLAHLSMELSPLQCNV